MKKLNLRMRYTCTIALGALIAAGAASAQTALPTMAATTAAKDDALYQQFGGQPGLVKLIDDFMVRLMADPRMQPFFKDTDQKDFKNKLVLQLCDVAGGPCKTKNPDMKETHADQHIGKSDFNALVEVLQQSMDAQGIAFATQNRLLARLAPMHREIINAD
jgi:hemoglobin